MNSSGVRCLMLLLVLTPQATIMKKSVTSFVGWIRLGKSYKHPFKPAFSFTLLIPCGLLAVVCRLICFFQSIGGTEAVNKSFGINLELLTEAHELALSLKRGTIGTNCMYFETGQGGALFANAHHSVDQQTIEARSYAVAREFSPLLVNSVVGFIGPEYLLDGKQITRAGLEDHFCGKLLGLPMGCDVCYTNHSYADQNDMDNLLSLLALAGCNF